MKLRHITPIAALLSTTAVAQLQPSQLQMLGPDRIVGCQGTVSGSSSQYPTYIIRNNDTVEYKGLMVLYPANSLAPFSCQNRIDLKPGEQHQYNCKLQATTNVMPDFHYAHMKAILAADNGTHYTVNDLDAFHLVGPRNSQFQPINCTETIRPPHLTPNPESIGATRLNDFKQHFARNNGSNYDAFVREFSQAVSQQRQSASSCDKPNWVITPVPTSVNNQLVPLHRGRVWIFATPVIAATCPAKTFNASIEFTNSGLSAPFKAVERHISAEANGSFAKLFELNLYTAKLDNATHAQQISLQPHLLVNANSASLTATRPLEIEVKADSSSSNHKLFIALDRPLVSRLVLLQNLNKQSKHKQ